MILSYSGGLDSTVLLYKYKDRIKLAVSFNYGSKHNNQEIKCAKRNCNYLGIEHIVIDLKFIGEHFNSSLLNEAIAVPLGHYQSETMRSTVVPFRNGIMLSILAGIAESRGISTIAIANHSGDHAIYPDCTPEFIAPMTRAIENGTYGNITLFAPFTSKTKRDIALIGQETGVPFQDTWTCYNGREKHCGKCGSCVERKEALAGFDKTVYES